MKTRVAPGPSALVCVLLVLLAVVVLVPSVACAAGITSNLASVHFVDATHGWAVGEAGTILVTFDGGAHWTLQPSGTNGTLDSVTFADATHGWAVGSNAVAGIILATTNGGATWTEQTHPDLAEDLHSVASVDATHAWAVGDAGTILVTSDGGLHWTTQTDPDTHDRDLYSVAFADPIDGWAVGGDYMQGGAVILSTSDGGVHWTTQIDPGPEPEDLMSVAFADSTHGWAAGDDGTFLVTSDGGLHWTTQTDPDPGSALFSVTATGSGDGWAVGSDDAGGIILSTTNGGANWAGQTDPDPYRHILTSVSFPDTDHGWAVGGGGTILVTSDGGAHWTVQLENVATTTKLSAPASVKVKRTLKISGKVSPSASPGTVTITKRLWIHKKWKSEGTAKVKVTNGKFSYSFKPKHKGKWRFYATYAGGAAGNITYDSSTSISKTVKVK